ncbi:MAG: tetratricopeptide repeat protein [Flavobacteriales bacterium]|nr:tetratricopeptide repeat protein [Flavobacteriales bacterium]
MDREYLSSLKKEFYNDDNDFNYHIKLYEEKQEEIESWFSDEDSYVALFAYKLAIIKYAVGLMKSGRYSDAENYLQKIEAKFRAYTHSEDKQKLLEFFQYYLAYSHFTTGNYNKAKGAFEKLLQCKPDVEAYNTAWKENERKITKKNANAFMLIGLILAIVGWVTDMNTNAHSMRYLLYGGIAIIGFGGVYSYFRNVKMK